MLLFGVFMPTLDQLSDISLVVSLMGGPEEEAVLNSSKIPTKKTLKLNFYDTINFLNLTANILFLATPFPSVQTTSQQFGDMEPTLQEFYKRAFSFYGHMVLLPILLCYLLSLCACFKIGKF